MSSVFSSQRASNVENTSMLEVMFLSNLYLAFKVISLLLKALIVAIFWIIDGAHPSLDPWIESIITDYLMQSMIETSD